MNSRCRLATMMLLLVMLTSGCAFMNPYLFLFEKEVTATPDQDNLPYQEVWFPATDGTRLNAWMIPGSPDKPLIVYFHGNTGNMSDSLGYLALLHSYGFPVFVFDYRGYGNSEGQPVEEEDLYRDARGALTYLGGQGWSAANMIFFGQSLGAAVALQMALEVRPEGLVMEGSFTSMRDVVKHISPWAWYTVGWWGIELSFDNLAKIGRVEVPLLLIHGDRDPIVPVQMSRRLYAQANGGKRLLVLNGGGHCDVFTRDSSRYQAAWVAYLDGLGKSRLAGTGLGREPKL